MRRRVLRCLAQALEVMLNAKLSEEDLKDTELVRAKVHQTVHAPTPSHATTN